MSDKAFEEWFRTLNDNDNINTTMLTAFEPVMKAAFSAGRKHQAEADAEIAFDNGCREYECAINSHEAIIKAAEQIGRE